MKDKLAKIIRVVTAPPFTAGLFILILAHALRQEIYTPGRAAVSLLCLSVVPLLAYPLSVCVPALKRGGRETQRNLAFLLSELGYAAGWFWAELSGAPPLIRYVHTAYLLSVLILLVFNRLLRWRSSGHSCGITGPVASLFCFAAPLWGALGALLLYPAALWASLRTGRHTLEEFLLGSLSFLLAAGLAFWRIPLPL